MNEKPSVCDKCPARSAGLGFVSPEAPQVGGRLCLIGQGPGQIEAETGRPFNPDAPSGFLLTKWLHQAGIPRSWCTITNIVWCWLPRGWKAGQPYGNREPTDAEMSYCYQHHLRPYLDENHPSTGGVIVTIGDPASRFFLGIEKVGRYRGTVNERYLP